MKAAKKAANVAVVLGLVAVLAGCTDAEIASRNLSKASDQFEVDRRVVFYNGITGEYMLVIEGKCSIHADNRGERRSWSWRWTWQSA